MPSIHKNILFLLGGNDLEMDAIRDLLKENNYDFIDKKLAWGAKLSEYQAELEANKNITIAGIELIEDIQIPSNYIKIDHHNELSGNLSSIEQVAEIIEVTLNRRQQLVAVNDTTHIAGMRNIGASKEEIEEIRKADRKIQGVSPEDEIQAEKDIKQARIQNGVTLIKTSIQHFSAITDRLEVPKLMVYNESKLCYYGIGANTRIKDEFEDLIIERRAYYGGKGEGYFGIVDGAYGLAELEILINKIINS